MPTLLQDIRYAFRTFVHNRIFAAVTILTLALGIGANTAIFGVLNSLIRPLNLPEPDRLVRIFSGPLGASYEISYPNYVDLRASAQSFSQLAVYSSPQPMSLGLGQNGASERIWGSVVSGNYFDTLGVSAAVGRTFVPMKTGSSARGRWLSSATVFGRKNSTAIRRSPAALSGSTARYSMWWASLQTTCCGQACSCKTISGFR